MTDTPAKPPRARKPKPAKPVAAPGFVCQFCQHKYVLESAFLVHMCAKKQRYLDGDLPHVKLGFAVYQRWWLLSFGAKKASARTFEEFVSSSYYLAFTKFGRYLRSINAIEPMQFVETLARGSVKLARWESPEVYEAYVRDLNKRETPEAAVERNVLLMQDWAVRQGEGVLWCNFFREIAPAQATLWIRSGRISPWVLYTAPSAGELFARLSPEQVGLIENYIDPDFWLTKLRQHADDTAFIRAELTAAGC